MKKQGKDMTLLQHVIDDLLLEKTLDVKFRDHALSGNYVGFRECHISPSGDSHHRGDRGARRFLQDEQSCDQGHQQNGETIGQGFRR